MSSENVFQLINMYFDNELNRKEEKSLFNLLAENQEARDYFKSMQIISEAVEDSKEEFPLDLDQKILTGIFKSEERKPLLSFFRNPVALLSYSFSIILLVIALLFYGESRSYQEQLTNTITQINYQKEQMELLLNSLPAAEVIGRGEEQVIIKSSL